MIVPKNICSKITGKKSGDDIALFVCAVVLLSWVTSSSLFISFSLHFIDAGQVGVIYNASMYSISLISLHIHLKSLSIGLLYLTPILIINNDLFNHRSRF